MQAVLQMLQLVSDEQVEEIGQVCRWVAVPVGGSPMPLRVAMRATCSGNMHASSSL